MATAAPPTRIGELLRSWRQRRNLSQLELSLGSSVSARHLSFIETGRARPSREMVVHLAERLEVPLRERNDLLLAAGYAPLYRQRALDAEDMTPVRQALDRFLRAHEPYPAVVVDGHWTIVAANDALHVLTDGVAPDLLEPPANGVRVLLHPRGMAPRIANLAEYSAEILRRVRRRAAITGDETLARLADELAGYPGVRRAAPVPEVPSADIVLPLRLRAPDGDGELVFLSTISTFGTAVDVTLAELAIEAFYPADAATATALLRDIGV
ncbi:MAG TPA: helix-turn-helix transcriptional regulator [Candidatus Dormibacteraeota bacterium]|jgi:transcriptional regulator with XRE-family HTH domain